MKCEPLDSPLWATTKTFSGLAADLIPVMRRLEAADWSKTDSSTDWVLLTGELVDGFDVSPAVELVLPWILRLSERRSPEQLEAAWVLIGDVEIARLASGHRMPMMEFVLEAAARVACDVAVRGKGAWQRELSAAICVLPRLPTWARLMTLRLVVIGKRYAACLSCGELLDVEWNEGWRVGEAEVELRAAKPSRQEVLDVIEREGTGHDAAGLRAVKDLAGIVHCPACGAENDVIQLLAYPRDAP
jgi:hypothetical protein